METHVTFVLDSSGSMGSIREDTIGGFNTFLADQQAEEGSATVTLFDFNSTVNRVYRGTAIEGASELTTEMYTPGGQTALHDAIVTAIDDTADFTTEIDEPDQPDNVVVVVLTDGKENASETPQEIVRERVETKQDESDWEFLFIGANQDAALTAEGMGIDAQNSLDMSHSGDGTQAAYESTSDRVSEVRQTGQTDGYIPEDRRRQDDA
jgi:Mg-chelatase subunit ChlD